MCSNFPFVIKKLRIVFEVYLYSWHHLKGYITQLEVWPESLTAIALGHDLWLKEQPPTGDWPPRRIQVKRSQVRDLKDAHERVEFFTAIGAIVLLGLNRYNMYQQVITEMCRVQE